MHNKTEQLAGVVLKNKKCLELPQMVRKLIGKIPLVLMGG
jgi:hypothetical protein